MGKKKIKNQKKIAEYLYDDYIFNKEFSSTDELKRTLKLLVDNGLGCMITANEATDWLRISKYSIASLFMCKYNCELKKYKREPEEYDFCGSCKIADIDEKILSLSDTCLDNGVYYAYLGNDKHDDYAVMFVSTPAPDDLYVVEFELYLIGKRFTKFKQKFNKMYKKYRDLYQNTRNEYICYTDGRPSKEVKFKPFDKMVFTNKKDIIKYVDNWVENIPNYHKYGILPKLSIMLYGEPGTGKSTFTKALAHHLGIERVMTYAPSFFINDDNSPRNFPRTGPYIQSISSIDDIDCICNAREEDASRNNNNTMSTLLEFLDNPPSFYFKAKDGKEYMISIVVATTNYYDKLDPAVKRHGRFDLKVEMNQFNKDEAEEMCKIYDLKLEDIYHDKIGKDFKISPSYLQALCMENIDKNLKDLYE